MNTATAEPRWLRLPATVVRALPRALAEGRSAEDAALLLRELGYQAGEPLGAALARTAADGADEPGELPAEEFWRALAALFAEAGWGTLRYEPLHPGVGALVADDWAEAEPEGGAAHPTCHFSTGLLAGLLGRAAGGEVAVLEVECRSRGDDVCRFLFGAPDALDALYRRAADGAAWRDALRDLG